MIRLRLPPTFMPATPLVPALDDVAGAEAEGEGLAAVQAGVELGAVLQPAGVVDLDDLAARAPRRPGRASDPTYLSPEGVTTSRPRLASAGVALTGPGEGARKGPAVASKAAWPQGARKGLGIAWAILLDGRVLCRMERRLYVNRPAATTLPPLTTAATGLIP